MDGYSVPRTGAGLSVVVGPGSIATSSGTVAYAGGPVVVTPRATTYCYLDNTGTLSTNTTGFPAGSISIFVAVADNTLVSKLSDARPNTTAIGASGSGTLEFVSPGVGDGVTTTFTFSFPPTVVTLNGMVQQPGVDYTASGNAANFALAPSQGDIVAAIHIH